MSAASCKAALCCSNLSATALTLEKLANRDEFNDDQLEELADIADKANHKLFDVAIGD